MMKRLLCIFVVAAVLLAGCGRDEDRRVVQGDDPVESTAAVDAEPTEFVGTDETEPGQPDEPLTRTLVVPEGYTLARIGMTLEEMGICTAEEFIQEAQTGDFSSYPLVAAQAYDENRCFDLEGYLFPDTYEIYALESPNAIIGRMLQNTEQRISQDLRARVAASGYTFDEVLTIASIIEKEAFGQQHMPGVSSVLHNRLDIGMQLQCDVTIVYVEGAIKPFITGDVNRYNSYYNTYKCPALPAGPICNPGMQAIEAALSPADTNYFYFVTDEEQNYLYAETLEEHAVNVALAGL